MPLVFIRPRCGRSGEEVRAVSDAVDRSANRKFASSNAKSSATKNVHGEDQVVTEALR